jgi:hypothetical protein
VPATLHGKVKGGHPFVKRKRGGVRLLAATRAWRTRGNADGERARSKVRAADRWVRTATGHWPVGEHAEWREGERMTCGAHAVDEVVDAWAD